MRKDAWEGLNVTESTERIVERPGRQRPTPTPADMNHHQRLLHVIDTHIRAAGLARGHFDDIQRRGESRTFPQSGELKNASEIAKQVYAKLSRAQLDWLAYLKLLEYSRRRLEEIG